MRTHHTLWFIMILLLVASPVAAQETRYYQATTITLMGNASLALQSSSGYLTVTDAGPLGPDSPTPHWVIGNVEVWDVWSPAGQAAVTTEPGEAFGGACSQIRLFGESFSYQALIPSLGLNIDFAWWESSAIGFEAFCMKWRYPSAGVWVESMTIGRRVPSIPKGKH